MGFLDSVKDIAGKFGESVERGAKTVSDNSKKFAEKNKIKRELSNIESNINNDYIVLGKAMFEKICNDPDNEFAETISDIKDKKQKLEELKNTLMSLEDKSSCPNCGAQIDKDQVFCDKCGHKLTPEDTVEKSEVVDTTVEEISVSSEDIEKE